MCLIQYAMFFLQSYVMTIYFYFCINLQINVGKYDTVIHCKTKYIHFLNDT